MVCLSKVSTFWLEDKAPLVSVSGEWLKEFGFEVGTKVVIDVTQGQIVIKPVDVEDDIL